MTDDGERMASSEFAGGLYLPGNRSSRRGFLKGVGSTMVFGGAAAALAACGSSSKPKVASGATTVPASTGGVSAATVSQLRDILGTPTGKAAGQGLTIHVGGSFGFSDGATPFGVSMYPGAQLAATHIEAMGGPKLVIDARDAGYGDTALGVAMARAFGSAGYPLVLTSLGADADSELPYFPQYKMFGIDSGAAELANEGLPFFYQGRSLFPIDPEVGLLEYWKQKEPQIKRVTYLTLATGSSAAEDALINAVKQRIVQGGFTWAGVVALPPTVTDFSPGFAQLRDQAPDGILSTVDGGPSSILQSQWANSGLKGKTILAGSDTLQNVTAAQADGFQFAFDYFQINNPGNDWGVLFEKEYLRVHGSWPIFPYYTANYYESTFLLWELIMRVIAAGGDPTKQGDQWVTAFNQNPTFPSVYGNSGKSGTNTFGIENHTLTKRLMTVGVYKGLTPTILATFYTGGVDFQLTNATL